MDGPEAVWRAKVFRLFGKQRLVDRSPDTPLDFRHDITPELAQAVLEIQTSIAEFKAIPINRRLRGNVVERYSRELASDNWLKTAQGICFAPNGRLLDGQHRLAAVVATGRTWSDALVSLDIPEDSILAIDGGSVRLAIDNIHAAGKMKTATKTHVSTANMMESQGYRQPIGSRKLTTQEIMDRLERYWDGISFAINACAGQHVQKVTVAPILSAVAKAYYSVGDDQRGRLERFVEIMVSGLPDDRSEHAAAALRNYLVTHDARYTGQERQDAHLRTQVAIRAFLAGEDRTLIRVPKSEIYPLQF